MARHALPLLFAASLFTGCVSSPASLTLAAPASRPRTASPVTTPASQSQIRLHAVEDRRSVADSTLGSVGNRPFRATDLSEWIAQELGQLGGGLHVVTGSGEGPPPLLKIHPRLLKAYVDSVGLTKTAVIVLEIEFVPASGERETHVFRGQHAAMNWSSSESEVIDALRKALAQCMDKVRPRIAERLPRA